MRHVFVIVDCSGSISDDGTETIGAINDLVRDLIEEFKSSGVDDIRVVCYANGAKLYWESKKEKYGFLDIDTVKFGGRSNLGKAYGLINEIVSKETLSMKDCSIILVSDGEATDDYKTALSELDGKKQAYRVAISLGKVHTTTERHASDDTCAFINGVDDRDRFIEKSIEKID